MKRFLTAIFLSFILCSSCQAQSLWDDNANWYGDSRPGKVGDIITVLINERTDAKDEATMEVTKSSNNDINGGNDGSGILKFIRGLTFSSANSSNGEGSTERKHHATGTIACLVTDLP